MQEDLNILRYWIETKYKKIIQEPGEKEQEMLDFNYQMKSKQTNKMYDNLQK